MQFYISEPIFKSFGPWRLPIPHLSNRKIILAIAITHLKCLTWC